MNLSADVPSDGLSASEAFGRLLFTKNGAFSIFPIIGSTQCPAPATDICFAPITYFLVSPAAQKISLTAFFDNTGALYLDGRQVATGAIWQTVNVDVPQGSFALSFVACSTDGASVRAAISNEFISAFGLSVDYDRIYHQNGK